MEVERLVIKGEKFWFRVFATKRNPLYLISSKSNPIFELLPEKSEEKPDWSYIHKSPCIRAALAPFLGLLGKKNQGI